MEDFTLPFHLSLLPEHGTPPPLIENLTDLSQPQFPNFCPSGVLCLLFLSFSSKNSKYGKYLEVRTSWVLLKVFL